MNPMKKWAKDPNRNVTKEVIQMANRYTRYSTTYVFRKMQIKTMRYHFTSIRLAKIQRLTPPNSVRMWRNSNCHTLMVVLQNDTATLEDV